MARPRHFQPYLHDLNITLNAPMMALSEQDGQVRHAGGGTARGYFRDDRRLLSTAVVTVDGFTPVGIRSHQLGADGARFFGTVRELGDAGPDPTVFVDRYRTLTADAGTESVTLRSCAREPLDCVLTIRLGCDLAPMSAVRSGRPSEELPAAVDGTGLRWTAPDGTTVHAGPDRPGCQLDPGTGSLSWRVPLAAGQQVTVGVTVRVANDPDPVVAVSATDVELLARPEITAADRRLVELAARSHADLSRMQLADARSRRNRFIAAGAPWYLTLFGRDALWTARMLLPLGTELAAGVLRMLASYQGTGTDPDTAEQPGRILHELRRAETNYGASRVSPAGNALVLPPVYYGTIDATQLWISVLHDAWRWGMPAAEVAELLPNLRRALDWLYRSSLDPNGFVSYVDASGHGLSNQGWKDSWDSVQFHDGEIARAPIALCEVQAYSYAAARQAADLLEAFDQPGAGGCRQWAAGLADRFRQRFWVDDPAGPYPAIALDGTGRPVDTVTSNIGHLLGTGLLNDTETALVVDRLATGDMDSGFGLRSMSSNSGGYNPQSYHNGSVWTHDTLIVIGGLTRVGTPEARAVAASLIHGLLRAAPAFGYRLPELFGGDPAAPGHLPAPYPASCLPQGWAAVAPYAMITAALGLTPDVPGGTLTLSPLRPSPFGELTVRGLLVAGQPLDIRLSATGEPTVHAPSTLDIKVR